MAACVSTELNSPLMGRIGRRGSCRRGQRKRNCSSVKQLYAGTTWRSMFILSERCQSLSSQAAVLQNNRVRVDPLNRSLDLPLLDKRDADSQ